MDAGSRWSANTRRAYAADWRDFERWAEARGVRTLPANPSAVELYLSEQAGVLAWPTVSRRRATIARMHLGAGLADPTAPLQASGAWEALRRRQQTSRRPAISTPLTVPVLAEVIAALPRALQGERDRALLLTGFAGAFRRSELVSVDLDDLDGDFQHGYLAPAGARMVMIVRGRGRTCPVRALHAWWEDAHLTRGPLFRSVDRLGVPRNRLGPSAVSGIVKAGVARIGIDPSGYSARSLRTGFIHAALAAGVSPAAVARQAGLPGAQPATDAPFTSGHLKAMGL